MHATKPDTCEVLRTVIVSSGTTLAEISRRAGVTEAVLSRFMRRMQGLNVATADRLMHLFGLRIVGADGKPPNIVTSR